MDKDVVLMKARVEVSKRLRLDYRMGSKTQKSAVLDQFCAATGLSRRPAQRYLTSPAVGVKNVVRMDRRRHKPTKYSKNAQRQLIRVWKMMGTACGKYMVAVMEAWIIALEAHGELVVGKNGWNLGARDQLLQMSAATIDRYLKDEQGRAGEPFELTPGALLTQTLVSSGTMTNRIDRLATAGLVLRVPSDDDRRVVKVRLTPEGKRQVDGAMAGLLEWEAGLLSRIPESDRHDLQQLLRTLLTSFEQ